MTSKKSLLTEINIYGDTGEIIKGSELVFQIVPVGLFNVFGVVAEKGK